MKKLVNLTPHTVKVVVEGDVALELSSVGVARVSAKTEVVGEVAGFELRHSEFGEVAGLPEAEEGTLFVVSRMVKSAVPHRHDCVVPDGLVRDVDGNILGCTGFAL